MNIKNSWKIVLVMACITAASASCKKDKALDGAGLSLKEAEYISAENLMGLTIKQSETLQVTAIRSPGNIMTKDVQYSTKHPDILTVNAEGLITAKSVGRDTLTVSTTTGAPLTVSYVVDVTE